MKFDRRFGIMVVALAALLVILGVGVLSAQRMSASSSGGILSSIERAFQGGDEGQTQETVSPQDKPSITADQAQATVLAANPGATIATVQLEKGNGVLQYSVKLNDGKEVLVNAANGQIMSVNQSEMDQEGEDGGD